jgi:curved DNA-binding protein CbpA
METLYDLLGALPEDGAEDLRAAFRNAVKSTHPDINPGDPDAGLKFRQIVRANEILSDHEQRAAYDHLLDLADIERKEGSKRAAVTTIYHLATGAMVLAVVSLVLLGGYMLFGYVNNVPLGPAQASDMWRAEPAKTILTEFVDTPGRTSDRVDADGDKKFENLRTIEESNALDAGASAAGASSAYRNESLPPAHDFGPVDANYYREQAISAYRNGDLYLALIKLDLAISFDPNSSDAYIDRSIVLHRLGDMKRAYADIAKAKQIDDSNRR